MKLKIRAVSGHIPPLRQPITIVGGESSIEIADLAELWDLRRDIGKWFIVDVGPDGEPELLIYDDHLE